MAENWRHWEPPLAIEAVPDAGLYLPDGRVLGESQLVWSEDEIERFRAGYKCVNCLEPQETAWPKNCICGYPMRSEQASFFARQFAGEVLIGRQTTLADELEGLEERRRKEDERRARNHDQLR